MYEPEAIRRLIARYCDAVLRFDREAFAATWAAAAVWHISLHVRSGSSVSRRALFRRPAASAATPSAATGSSRVVRLALTPLRRTPGRLAGSGLFPDLNQGLDRVFPGRDVAVLVPGALVVGRLRFGLRIRFADRLRFFLNGCLFSRA